MTNPTPQSDDDRVLNGLEEQLEVLAAELPPRDRQGLVRELRRFLFDLVYHRPVGSPERVLVARFPADSPVPTEILPLARVIAARELELVPGAVARRELVLTVAPTAPKADTYFIDADRDVFEEFLATRPGLPPTLLERYRSQITSVS